MATVRLSTEKITDWTSFHLVCKEVLGFPDFYGMNMNAWIDCLTYRRNEDGMSRIDLAPGELLHIEVSDTEDFRQRQPEVFDALVRCTAHVNQRYIEMGDKPAISLVFM